MKLPERRLWWIKVQPFVSECLKHGNHTEARKYIPRLSPEMRVKAYLSAGDMPGAVASALERRCELDVAAVLSHPLAAQPQHSRLVETLRGAQQ
ncbi:unnamed protein product [Lampetra fluviatilis]